MRVLSVVHEPTSTGGGGLFERAVTERGDELDRWVAAAGDPPPGEPSLWDAVMVFGGIMHPDQEAEHPWLERELALVGTALAERTPILGVCLGAQLIARAAGAHVGPATESEVGWYPVEVNEDGIADPVLGVLPRRITAFQWHHYTFELPAGAVQLASSPAARQAYRLGDRAWGIQFHAEVERHMLDRWLTEGRAELAKPLAEVEEETERHLSTWNVQGRALCDAFLNEAARRRGLRPVPGA